MKFVPAVPVPEGLLLLQVSLYLHQVKETDTAYCKGTSIQLRNKSSKERKALSELIAVTDGRTDEPSYRDARTHLKMIGGGW